MKRLVEEHPDDIKVMALGSAVRNLLPTILGPNRQTAYALFVFVAGEYEDGRQAIDTHVVSSVETDDLKAILAEWQDTEEDTPDAVA